jgi:N-acetylglucosamine kinase-like BadF-type ATPase
VDELISWAAKAQSTEFASLVALILKHFNKNEMSAVKLIDFAVKEIELLIDGMCKRLMNKEIKIALIGGVSKVIGPLLREDLKERLQDPILSPAEGGILLIEKYIKDKNSVDFEDRW